MCDLFEEGMLRKYGIRSSHVKPIYEDHSEPTRGVQLY